MRADSDTPPRAPRRSSISFAPDCRRDQERLQGDALLVDVVTSESHGRRNQTLTTCSLPFGLLKAGHCYHRKLCVVRRKEGAAAPLEEDESRDDTGVETTMATDPPPSWIRVERCGDEDASTSSMKDTYLIHITCPREGGLLRCTATIPPAAKGDPLLLVNVSAKVLGKRSHTPLVKSCVRGGERWDESSSTEGSSDDDDDDDG